MDNDELLIRIKDVFDKKTEEVKDAFDKKTEELKDAFDKKTEELKQYVSDKIDGQSVLIENLQSDIQAVAEGHEILNRKIDSLNQSVENQVNELKYEIKTISGYITRVDNKVNAHDVIMTRVK